MKLVQAETCSLFSLILWVAWLLRKRNIFVMDSTTWMSHFKIKHKPFRIAKLNAKDCAFVSFSKTVVLDDRLSYQFHIAPCNGTAVCIPDRKELWSRGCTQCDEFRLFLLHVFIHTALLQLYINKISSNRHQIATNFMLVIGKPRKCFDLRRPSSGGVLTHKQIYNVVNSIVLIGCMI